MLLRELLDKFQFQKTLKSDPQTKTLVLLGTIDDQDAILVFEKSTFSVDSEAEFSTQKMIEDLKLIQNNDIYYWSLATLSQHVDDSPTAKVNLIFPATELYVKRFAQQRYHIIRETPSIYKDVVAPFI